jgi:serine/threonine protein kinase/ankyrin repeat protein
MAQLQQGSIFHDRYELVRQIGVGGFAVVWKVRDTQTDLFWAMKVYAPENGLDTSGVEAFKSDYQRTLHLNHPHLLTPNHFGIAGGSPYLLMELCEQGSLEHYLQAHFRFTDEEQQRLAANGAPEMYVANLHNRLAFRSPQMRQDVVQRGYLTAEEAEQWGAKTFLSEAVIAKVMRDVADGLQYLHTREPQILHRDIKTGNVLIDDQGNYLVTDFGISSRVKTTLRKATSQASAISVAYAPPERFEARPVSVPEGDIFSLGVMLYELCEGDVPWDSAGGMALMRGASLPDLPDAYTNRLNKIVKNCLHPQYEKRPSAARLVELANGFLSNGFWEDVPFEAPVSASDGRKTTPITGVFLSDDGNGGGTATGEATNTGGGTADQKPKKKSKSWVAILLLLLMGGGGGGGYLWWQHDQKLQAFRGLINEGNRYYDTDRLLEAKATYQDAQNLFPDNPEVQQNIKTVDRLLAKEVDERLDSAGYFISKQQYQVAMEVLKRAAVYGPENTAITDKLAEASFLHHKTEGEKYLASGNYTSAEQELTQALSFRKDDGAQQMLDQVKAAAQKERLAKVNEDLLAAVKANNLEAVKAALAGGGDANLKDGSGIHLMYWAAFHGSAELVKALKEAGGPCEPTSNPIRLGNNAWLGHPIVLAAYKGNKELVQYYIEQCGISVNQQEYDPVNRQKGWHALACAAYAGKLDVVRYLVGKGANVELNYGRTALIEAAAANHYEVAAFLIEKGADVKAQDANGNTAFGMTTNSSIKNLIKQRGGGSFSYVNGFARADNKFADFKNKQREMSVFAGTYVINALEDGFCYDETAAFEVDTNQDFVLKVDAKWKTGSDDAPFGLIFGANNNETSYYVFQVSSKGSYAIMKLKDGKWEVIKKWTPNVANSGRRWNNLRVERKSGKLYFFVNDREVERISAPALAGNRFGMLVCNKQEVSFDNFEISGVAK